MTDPFKPPKVIIRNVRTIADVIRALQAGKQEPLSVLELMEFWNQTAGEPN